jgi:hypothetical protein
VGDAGTYDEALYGRGPSVRHSFIVGTAWRGVAWRGMAREGWVRGKYGKVLRRVRTDDRDS